MMPLNLEIKIPQDDSVRLLMRIAERIDWSKLSGMVTEHRTTEKVGQGIKLRTTAQRRQGRGSPGTGEYGVCCRMHIAVFAGQQGRNSRPVRAIIGGQQAA